MDSLYSIGVRLSMDTAGFGTAASLAMGVLQKLEQQSIAAGASTASLGKSIGLLAGGMALVAGGVAGVDMLKGWVSAAGQMQDALVQVGIAASGTKAQLGDLFQQSFAVANKTQFSGSDVLNMEQIMATMGFRDLSGKQTPRQVIGEAIDQFARAAEITQHFQGTGYKETTTALAQMAHMFGAYSGNALAQNVAWATGAGLVSHMQPAQLVNVLRYMAPAVRSGQIDSLDAITLAALGNQTGLTVGGKAASSIGTLLRELSPNGSPKHDENLAKLEKLGGGDFYQNGKFVGLPAALAILNQFYDATKNNTPLQTEIAKYALLVQGNQAASVLASDTSIAQFGNIHSRLVQDTPAWQKATQNQLNDTLPGQLKTLAGNLGSIRSLLGTQLLPVIVPVVHGFVQLTSAIVDMLRLHPQVASFIATFAAVATAAALIAGPILVAAGAFGLLSLALVPLGIELLPITAIILAAVGAVTAITLVVTHWGQITQAMSPYLSALGRVVTTIFPGLVTLAATAKDLWQYFGGWAGILHGLGSVFSALGTQIHGVVVQMQALAKLMPHMPGGGSFDWGAFAREEVRNMFPFLAPFTGTGGGGVLPQRAAPASAGHHGIQVHIEHVHGVTPQNARQVGKEVGKEVAKQLHRQSRQVTPLTPVPSGM